MLWYDEAAKELRMAATPPVIYLDHGPMGQIAENPVHAERLAGLIRRSGTLALSQASLMEIANQDDGDSLDAIQGLLESIGTAFCWMRTDPLAYANAAARRGDERIADALDIELARDYVQDCFTISDSPFSAAKVVPWTRQWPLEDRREFARNTKSRFGSLLRRAQERHRQEGWLPKVREGEPRALECYAEITRVIAKEKIALPRPNDGIDMLHAMVPLAACDFLVLDAGWAELVRRVPLSLRRAAVYSGKKGQIDAFLDALELFFFRWEVK